LEDECVQCQGNCSFEYAINFNKGEMAELPNKAAQIFANVKCAVCGRGKGNLKAQKCRMDETVLGDFDGVIEAKKIVTLRIDK